MKELEAHKIESEDQFMYWLKDEQGIAGQIVGTRSHSDTNEKLLIIGKITC